VAGEFSRPTEEEGCEMAEFDETVQLPRGPLPTGCTIDHLVDFYASTKGDNKLLLEGLRTKFMLSPEDASLVMGRMLAGMMKAMYGWLGGPPDPVKDPIANAVYKRYARQQ
jgi:hypothetical protein